MKDIIYAARDYVNNLCEAINKMQDRDLRYIFAHSKYVEIAEDKTVNHMFRDFVVNYEMYLDPKSPLYKRLLKIEEEVVLFFEEGGNNNG